MPIITTVATCTVAWFVNSFMLSECAISVCIVCTCFIIAFICLCLPSWDFLLLTPCNVMGLLFNNKDAAYYQITLLPGYIQVCFCLNVFWTGLHYIWLQLRYMTAMPMGMANYIMIYEHIGQCYYTICTCLHLCISGQNTELLPFHVLSKSNTANIKL